MALTEYGVNAPEAVKLWSRKLAREALKQTYINRFIGTSDDSLIQERTDTKKSEGDRIRITLRMQLDGDGIQGDGTLEGNEEALTTYTDDILINQLRHAVRSQGTDDPVLHLDFDQNLFRQLHKIPGERLRRMARTVARERGLFHVEEPAQLMKGGTK